ncbi:glycosyl transferase [Thioalkalivibrio sulfidiphilus HL-EbGr7]|uniref:Glycosyl transferase n=1 Tax=Thioalkalivibrio sulfidiphilus (strain HL-EbGR7) TaxID=396588 RepID=B8GTT0_THISH|nr:glycosyltransferase WbuB [Thioalkalivibrio sulfidiphilus]ACL73174.1 glycosyl transferase [Thioalkalivibrio sulfidiphilus HL-EbGr7]
MRILLYGINFAPELTGIGKYSGEMAAWLAARGHDVQVVTAPPYYPDWRVLGGYSPWKYRRESWCFDDQSRVRVHRCPIWVPRKPSGKKRLIHLASFALSSLPVALAHARWRPDVVMSVEPTLAVAPTALLLARLARAKSWLHVQDFEVDAAFDMGLVGGGWFKRQAMRTERALLSRFDRVSTISDRMMDRFAEKGVMDEARVLFPNWADTHAICPLDKPSVFRHELGLSSDAVVVLYSGNLGEKQGLEVLIEAAKLVADERNVVWVIAGTGSARARLEAMSSGLSNVRWLPLQPLERLNELLNLADIHVLPQRADAADLVMPSKLTGMLASGRATVATATKGTQVGQVMDECGVRVPPGDPRALAEAVVELARDESQRKVLGARARTYAEKHLGYDSIMTRFEAELNALVSGSARPVLEEK